MHYDYKHWSTKILTILKILTPNSMSFSVRLSHKHFRACRALTSWKFYKTISERPTFNFFSSRYLFIYLFVCVYVCVCELLQILSHCDIFQSYSQNRSNSLLVSLLIPSQKREKKKKRKDCVVTCRIKWQGPCKH